MSKQLALEFVDNSRYNWPWPERKDRSEFRERDWVRIARIPDNGLTNEEILGHWGQVIDVDSEGAPFLWLLEFRCMTCRGVHTMNEEEMDLVYSPGLSLIEEKAGIPPEGADPKLVEKRRFNDEIAFYLHEAGFRHISVKDHMGIQFGKKPAWRKIARFMYQSGMVELNQVLGAITCAINRAGGQVEDFQCQTRHGYVSVAEDELEALVFEMPIQLIFRSNDPG